jgi:predicted nucleic acid-binding protein
MMFVLDTNVLSAMMRPDLETEITAWVGRQDEELLFTTAISQAEISAGLAILPDGRRRRDLEALATAIFAEEFEGRVLSFDMNAAAAYADIFASRRRDGRPTPPMDLMIAAIARSQGASVVTRDTGGFEGCGLVVINPWSAS